MDKYFEWYGCVHERGNEHCSECEPARCECGGLIHSVIIDEHYISDDSDDIELEWDHICDQCGSDFTFH